MTEAQITVTVKLFAAYQDACSASELKMVVAAGTTVSGVRDRLIEMHPELAQWRDLTRFGINLQFVEPETLLQADDEVVLIPPVSGGAIGGSLPLSHDRKMERREARRTAR